jgi:Flp pilus assembly pilin Flp
MVSAVLQTCNVRVLLWEFMMQVLMRQAGHYRADESGAAAVEYVVIAAAMTLALVPGFYWVSDALQAKFDFIIDFIMGT